MTMFAWVVEPYQARYDGLVSGTCHGLMVVTSTNVKYYQGIDSTHSNSLNITIKYLISSTVYIDTIEWSLICYM